MKHIKKFESESESMDIEYIKSCFMSLIDDYNMEFTPVTKKIVTVNIPGNFELRKQLMELPKYKPRYYESCEAKIKLPKVKGDAITNEPAYLKSVTGTDISKYIEHVDYLKEMYLEVSDAIERIKPMNINYQITSNDNQFMITFKKDI